MEFGRRRVCTILSCWQCPVISSRGSIPHTVENWAVIDVSTCICIYTVGTGAFVFKNNVGYRFVLSVCVCVRVAYGVI